ncbi:hypothetical protein N8000_05340 [Rhodospirillales bacterium]|nr:hypothetical protein [Rhodospirillales bacterium]
MKIIAEQQPPTMGDAWSEYLCIEAVGSGEFELSVRIREFLGNCNDFYDDDGEFQEPSEIDGKKVFAIEDEFIIGEKLVKKSNDAQFTYLAGHIDDVRGWLKKVEWDEVDISKIINALPK